MPRGKIVCGNWKMHGTVRETEALIQALISQIGDPDATEAIVCPPFPSLITARQMLVDSPIQLGAQNCHFAHKGAFTGEVSPVMLAEIGCSHVILGHSERRTLFGETDELISAKVLAAIEVGLRPIVCVGETLEERESEQTEAVLRRQLAGSLKDVSASDVLIVAYEPVWAIGTGKTATPEQAQLAHAFIREELANAYSRELAQSVCILYGGSVKPDNARELFSQPDIDGGLIGGASLDAHSFLAIVSAATARA